MTGYSEISYYERAKKLNPAAYLEKPIEIFDLQQAIESIIFKEK